MPKTLPQLVYDPDFKCRNPDRGLRMAILDRAIRDLKEEPLIRRQTIKWFRSESLRSKNNKFTFHQIIEDLDLGKKELKFIDNLVREAEKVWNPQVE